MVESTAVTTPARVTLMATVPAFFFIVNPRSAGGRTGARWERQLRPLVAARFGGAAQWALTERPGDAVALAALARREGAGVVVAVGGDGTIHEVVNGLMRQPWSEAPGSPFVPALGVVPSGTGGDFARTIAVPRSPVGALDLLAAAETRLADLCEVTCTSPDGRQERRFCINTCGCGIGGEVAARVNRAGRRRHGFLAFLAASLRTVVSYRARPVTLAVDGGEASASRVLALFVCNGQYCGGGMRPGMGARIDDGLLRIVEVGPMHPARIAIQLHRLYSGKVLGVRGVRVRDAVRVDVRGAADVLVDCDGEQPGGLPASFVVRPGALPVIVGRRARG